MSTIVIQEGHVARTTGVTGTHREQEFAKTLGGLLSVAFTDRGHRVHLIGADDAVPSCDVFIALHLDGNVDHTLHGASVGYPSNDPKSPSGLLANAWKKFHQHYGYSWGFHKDNYTDNLRFYYGFRKSNAKYEFLAEHGTSTNPEEELWLFSHYSACVMAHVDAVGEVVGHPKPVLTPPTTTPEIEEDMRLWLMRVKDDPKIWITDLITKRHVQSEDELNDLVYLNKTQGGKMLWVPEPGTESGPDSYKMVRVLGNDRLIGSIPVA